MSSQIASEEIKASALPELGNYTTVLEVLTGNKGKWVSASAFTKKGQKIAKKLARQGKIAKGYFRNKDNSESKVYKI